MTQNKKTKRITAQALFATLSIMLIPTYTLVFGTRENPFMHTLSGIGNAFDHKLSFIFWGSLTGLSLAYYTLYVFSKIGYQDKTARRFLYGSQGCLIMTVLTPALKDMFPVWHFIHVTFSTLFAFFFVASILLFLQYISRSHQDISKKSFFLLIACVGISVLSLFLMGLTGVVEILFFIGISVFLFVLNIYLDSIAKEQPGIARSKKRRKPGKKK